MNIPGLGKIKGFFERKSVVLMYHRIADVKTDPWELAVTTDNFEQQLKVLKTNYNVISVDEMIEQLRKGRLSSKAVCITFDDGYKDNYLTARPLLEKYSCPATFFITTAFINKERGFWWDELEEIILHTSHLPCCLKLKINGEVHVFKLEKDELTSADIDMQKTWRWSNEPPTERCRFYLQLWEQLNEVNNDEIESALVQIRSWAGAKTVYPSTFFPMSMEQVKRLAAEPLFSLGVHTHTHPALSFHSKPTQAFEITTCKSLLEKVSMKPVRNISYPHGKFNRETIEVVKENNLKAAFTTEEIPVTKRSQRYELGRFQVGNWSGEEFANKIRAWFQQ